MDPNSCSCFVEPGTPIVFVLVLKLKNGDHKSFMFYMCTWSLVRPPLVLHFKGIRLYGLKHSHHMSKNRLESTAYSMTSSSWSAAVVYIYSIVIQKSSMLNIEQSFIDSSMCPSGHKLSLPYVNHIV